MQKQLILGLLLVSLGSQCQSFPMPSHACQDAARTENIIKCLSYTGQFQDTRRLQWKKTQSRISYVQRIWKSRREYQ